MKSIHFVILILFTAVIANQAVEPNKHSEDLKGKIDEEDTTTTTTLRIRNTKIISRNSKYEKYDIVFLSVFIPFIWLLLIAIGLGYYYRVQLKLDKRVILLISKSRIKKQSPNPKQEIMI